MRRKKHAAEAIGAKPRQVLGRHLLGRHRSTRRKSAALVEHEAAPLDHGMGAGQ